MRYARHLLLSQLGEAGQARLLRTSVHAGIDADRGVLAVARCYLERAGVFVLTHDSLPEHGSSAEELALVSSDEVERMAGVPALEEATRALLGALAAVRVIQEVVGLPASPLPSQSFAISSEEA